MSAARKGPVKKRSRRPPQHVIYALGVGIGVTFDGWAEEDRVRAKAERLGVSVDHLIVRAIDKAVRRPTNIKHGVHEVIDRALKALKALAAPRKRRRAG